MSDLKSNPVLVVLSGGQDSTTCLFWAKSCFGDLHALTFNYGQRHYREIDAAMTVGVRAECKTHEFVEVGPILKSTSPLVDHKRDVGTYEGVDQLPGGVEPTFVPGRNALFLVLACNRALHLGIKDIVIGVCEEDYGGYFDCRDEFIRSMARTLSFGLTGDSEYFTIHTPLMYLTKAQTVQIADQFPGCWEALAYSHTCYNGEYPPCGKCHACLLRARGFQESEKEDPLIHRWNIEQQSHANQ